VPPLAVPPLAVPPFVMPKLYQIESLTWYKISATLDGMTETRRKLALLGCLFTIVLAILDQNIVSAAAVPIVRDLDPVHGLSRLPWLITAYALAATAVLPLYGKLCDVFGAKPVYLTTVAVFLAGSALCGLARNMPELIAFRALQGVGGGGLMSVTMVVLAQLSTPDRRAGAGGLGGIVAGVGLVIGPLVGGVLADHAGWRWIFYVNLPLGVLILANAVTVLHLPRYGERHRIDFLGAGLAAAAAVVLLLVTEWGGREYAWASPAILGLAGGGAVLLALFVWRELAAAEPILPLSLLANRTLRVALPVQLLAGAALLGSVVYVLVYLQVARAVPAADAGLYLIPMALGMTVAGTVSGRLIARAWSARTFLISGTAIVAAAIGLLGLLRADTPWWVLGAELFLLGAGLGQLIGLLVVLAQKAVPPGQLGVATTAVRFAQTLGGAFGAALFGTVLTRALTARLPAGPVDATRIRTLGPDAVPAFVAAIDVVFRSASAVMVVAFVLALFLREPSRSAPVGGPLELVGEG
jgi:EmrB/QacA subfamily drug resistance transporter